MNVLRWIRATRYFVLGAALLAAACDDGANTIGPQNQLEVSNAANTFEWQATALSNVTQTLSYTWANSGTVANVNQSSSLGGGSAQLQVKDANGVQVYARSLAENGTFETTAGTAGNWTVTVTLTEVNGTLNFRLQKP